MKENSFYVYGYYDPITNDLFYVGKGAGYRDVAHLKPSYWADPRNTANPFLYHKIKSLMDNGSPPIVRRLHENLTEDEAYDIEASIIEENGRRFVDGGTLFNISGNRGGSMSGGKKPWTEERRLAYKEACASGRLANDREELADMFLNKCMTRNEIARHYGVSEVLIKKRLQEFRIKKDPTQRKKTSDRVYTKNRKTLVCECCQKEFEVASSQNRKYCSMKCAGAARLEEVTFKGITYKNKYEASKKTGLSSVYISVYKDKKNEQT